VFGARLIAAFDMIGAAIAEVRRDDGDVRVSTLSSFLTLWLVPRLGGFQSLHAGTRLLLSTGMRAVDLVAEPYDCAIRWGRGDWPDLAVTKLFRDRGVVVIRRLMQRDKGGLRIS
jgi:DNA-binding transcriptional LysR family regulator